MGRATEVASRKNGVLDGSLGLGLRLVASVSPLLLLPDVYWLVLVMEEADDGLVEDIPRAKLPVREGK